MTTIDFEILLASQNGECAICHTAEPGLKGWAVDHDHVTGRVRGILCNHCNFGIGHMKDDASILRSAADYLERD